MLGAVMLSITGTEALFADLGHFSIKSIGVRCSQRQPMPPSGSGLLHTLLP
jgi:hypothetical protein